eukprot:TRINITY_DN9419_c2_g2_i3.p1 TRINITY_DN9419_c2_g2~~TRINITY_DN9419_c2_g2_i3.p1  ORF type:complete len:245 (+),score=75.91 TRINITY_DN9419_c2_g2_i3:14-748(+)
MIRVHRSRPLMLSARRWCSKEAVREERGEPPLFDTYEVVVELRKTGVKEEQATAIMKMLDKVIANTVNRVRAEYVPKQTYNGELQRQWSELDQMRRNILVLEKTEMFSLRRDIEKLMRQIETVGSNTEAQLTKVEHGVKLDQSLLKSHVHTELQKTHDTIETRVQTEINKLEHHFSNNVHREIAQAKLDAYRNIVALVIAIATMVMTYLRFFPLSPQPAPVAAIPPAPVQQHVPQQPVINSQNE